VGLLDPRSGSRPHAVVQLRAENLEGSCFNLVGFQTRLVQGEQRRVFRMIPGLEHARFLRYGSIHRNTYLDSPRLLDGQLRLRGAPQVTVAGQLAGVEGYLESTALGLVAGLLSAARLRQAPLDPPPPTTALGALVSHVTRPRGERERFEPSNITFGLLPEPRARIRDRRRRREQVRSTALDQLDLWLGQVRRRLELAP
jgi:methylenetetrahydrofolate--tRNA-(uracil-5-)-methyltransferase